MRYRAAGEVPAGLVQGKSFGNGHGAGPEGDVRVVAAEPLAVCLGYQDRDVSEAS
jgi:hypothetical protein